MLLLLPTLVYVIPTYHHSVRHPGAFHSSFRTEIRNPRGHGCQGCFSGWGWPAAGCGDPPGRDPPALQLKRNSNTGRGSGLATRYGAEHRNEEKLFPEQWEAIRSEAGIATVKSLGRILKGTLLKGFP